VNLGFALTIWDQLAGRAMFPTEATIRTDTGLPGRTLVVEHAKSRPHHVRVFAAQLIAPFRPWNDLAGPPTGNTQRHREEATMDTTFSKPVPHDGEVSRPRTEQRTAA
jgi:hypothetical protein